MQHRHRHLRALKQDASIQHAKKAVAAIKRARADRAVGDAKKS